jgi:hypothetical protein
LRRVRRRLGACGGLVDQFADPGARAAALQVQPADVDAVLREDRQDGVAARGVRGHIAVVAADEHLAEVTPARRLRQPYGHPQRGGGERGDTLRFDAGRVLGEDESVNGGGEGAGQLGDAGSQSAEFLQDVRLGCHQLSPLGRALPFQPVKGPEAHPSAFSAT